MPARTTRKTMIWNGSLFADFGKSFDMCEKKTGAGPVRRCRGGQLSADRDALRSRRSPAYPPLQPARPMNEKLDSRTISGKRLLPQPLRAAWRRIVFAMSCGSQEVKE